MGTGQLVEVKLKPDLIKNKITHVRTRLGHTLNVKGVPSLQDPQTQVRKFSHALVSRMMIEMDPCWNVIINYS